MTKFCQIHVNNMLIANQGKINRRFFASNHIVVNGFSRDCSHLVDVSPWPIVTAFNTLSLVLSGVCFMNGYLYSNSMLFIFFIFLLVSMGMWWRDVIREATFQGKHNLKVQIGLRLGTLLFIISEIMFFFAFFWAFFHSSISPSIDIGVTWPPKGIETLAAFGIPFSNTIILLTSGVSITWCHHAILKGSFNEAFESLVTTIVLAILFTWCQYCEYCSSNFTIADGVFGSCFYMTTGFHGFHVIVGTCFLIIALLRLLSHHFTKEHHFGFEAAAWYWHFVDVVWIGLFTAVYWWGA
jgi:cytochrome c oxidase subunit 3